MKLAQHISVGSVVETFETDDRTKGTVLDFDEHGIVLDEAGTKFYIPWSSVKVMRIDSTPEDHGMDTIG
ncbi:hypothetical protein [uncultured Microbacterium sp.]|uniref:hypothetical protein n=1 Tax=uncultured Microbacterium sp. TaxID=191216 RepID=UPI0028E2A93F|nr:hypothetical protein [uncultured Microbacterium sp.]